MSVQAMARVWDLDLPHAERLVLLALADHADHMGDNIYPSIGLIAWKTGYGERQVQRIIKSLVKMEILCVVDQPIGRTTIYRMDLSAGTVKAPYPRQNVTPDKMSPLTKRPTKIRQNVTPTPDIAMSPKPLRKPSLKSGGDTRTRDAAAAETQRLSVEQQGYVTRLIDEQMLMRDQATAAAALECVTSEALDCLKVWRVDMIERNRHLPQQKQKKPQAILAWYFKQGKLPDDLPPPPQREMTEAEKEARYMADFYSRTVHPADYRR